MTIMSKYLQMIVLSLSLVNLGSFENTYAAECRSNFGTNFKFSSGLKSIAKFFRKKSQIHVSGLGISGQLLFLTKTEYRKRVLKEDIDPNTILVLEEIDTSLDLPLVAGLIISKPMGVGGTHIEVLCEKMDIPFIYKEGFYGKSLKKYQKDKRYYKLDTRSRLKLLTSQYEEYRLNSKSIFPKQPVKNFENAENYLIHHQIDRGKVFDTGEKFYNLRRALSMGVEGPSVVVATINRFYLDFMSQYKINGLSLETIINSKLQELENQSAVVQKHILKEIRQSILASKTSKIDLFEELYKELKIYFDDSNINLSIRSNNVVEDIIASGLYESIKTNGFTKETVEEGVRKVFASVYTYRAFSIRRTWGLNENNTSMNIMIHEFTPNTLYHAVGEYSLTKANEIHLELNLSKKGNSTNPLDASKSHKLIFLSGRLISGIMEEGAEAVVQEVIRSSKKLSMLVKNDLTNLLYRPDFVEIELSIDKETNGKYGYTLLQYKPRYGKETVLDILSGKIPYESLLGTFLSKKANMNLERFIKERKVLLFENTLVDTFIVNLYGYRFILIELFGIRYILSWKYERNGFMHQDMIEDLNRVYGEKAIVLDLGYIRYIRKNDSINVSFESEALRRDYRVKFYTLSYGEIIKVYNDLIHKRRSELPQFDNLLKNKVYIYDGVK